MQKPSMYRSRAGWGLLLAVSSLLGLGSCTEAPPKPVTRYTMLGPRNVPAYLKDSVLQYTDLSGIEPFPISGYGLVTHLHGTGGSRVPTPVRAYMLKMLAQHQVESPEAILGSKDVAIVRIDGLIPPGARCALDHGADADAAQWELSHDPSKARDAFRGDTGNPADWCTWFDVRVSIPPGSDATSLAHGDLWQTDLKINGANPAEPGGGMVAVKGQAAGAVFVNPEYVLDSTIDTPAATISRKSGVILTGARALEDRPLLLRLRSPEARMSRAIEQRIIERFQDVVDDDLRPAAGQDAASSKKIANAQDEGVVYVYVPKAYTGDWEHFAGIVRHLYLQGADPTFAAMKARELADEAIKPDAPLSDISFCWEGLGKPALFAMTPLLSSDKPDVQFAAARAAAFLNDPAAVPVLLSIAQTSGNPFRINAVRTLAQLPSTPRLDRLCRPLLDSDEAMVRIEAYKLLARHGDASIFTRWVKDRDREVFALDLIHGSGPPMVFATRQGVPRIAVFGLETELALPLIFTAMDNRLTISSNEQDKSHVTIFYRGFELPKPVSIDTSPSLPELVRVLAGDSDTDFRMHGLHFGYADVVAILQSLISQQRVTGLCRDQRLLASFVLQEPGKVFEPTDTRPLLREDGSRPQSDKPGPIDKPDDHLLRESAAVQGPVLNEDRR